MISWCRRNPIASFGVALLSLTIGWAAVVTACGDASIGTGPFGDAFGPINGFGAALAAVLGLVSIRQQQEELEANREELAGQRAEHERELLLLSAATHLGLIRFARINSLHIRDLVLGRSVAGPPETHFEHRVSMAHTYLGMLRQWHTSSTEIIRILDQVQGSEVDLSAEAEVVSEQPERLLSQGVSWSLIAVAAAMVVLLFLGWGNFVAMHRLSDGTIDQPIGTGLFGDAFSPLAGMATVGALWVTLWSVGIQRLELRETRAELRRQRTTFSGQNTLRIIDLRVGIQTEIRASLADMTDIVLHQKVVVETIKEKCGFYTLFDDLTTTLNTHGARVQAALEAANAANSRS